MVVSNPFGSATSSNALLTVRVPPFIITQLTPTNQIIIAGTNTTIIVLAGGDPTLAYQWRLNGTNISGATNATLTLAAVQTNQLGLYSVVVSNPYGSVTSSNATLDVKTARSSSSSRSQASRSRSPCCKVARRPSRSPPAAMGRSPTNGASAA